MANVLITGCNRGIGLEMARQYVAAGDRVYACVRTPAKADKLNEFAAQSGGKLTVHAMDVGDDASIKACAAAIGADTPIDILINNAGIVAGENQALGNIDTNEWLDAFRIMAIGPFRVVEAFLPNLEKAANGARIMSVTSQLAASTWPYGGFYGYASAKIALNRISQIFAIDLKDRNIVSAVVHPGWVKTDMGGPEADITPEESASGIRNVIAGLTPEKSGGFFKWNGDIHPM